MAAYWRTTKATRARTPFSRHPYGGMILISIQLIHYGRNVFTMSEEIKPYQLYNVVSYVRHQMQYLHSLPLEAFMEGKVR